MSVKIEKRQPHHTPILFNNTIGKNVKNGLNTMVRKLVDPNTARNLLPTNKSSKSAKSLKLENFISSHRQNFQSASNNNKTNQIITDNCETISKSKFKNKGSKNNLSKTSFKNLKHSSNESSENSLPCTNNLCLKVRQLAQLNAETHRIKSKVSEIMPKILKQEKGRSGRKSTDSSLNDKKLKITKPIKNGKMRSNSVCLNTTTPSTSDHIYSSNSWNECENYFDCKEIYTCRHDSEENSTQYSCDLSFDYTIDEDDDDMCGSERTNSITDIPVRKSSSANILLNFRKLLNEHDLTQITSVGELDEPDVELLRRIVEADEKYLYLKRKDYSLLKEMLLVQKCELETEERILEQTLTSLRNTFSSESDFNSVIQEISNTCSKSFHSQENLEKDNQSEKLPKNGIFYETVEDNSQNQNSENNSIENFKINQNMNLCNFENFIVESNQTPKSSPKTQNVTKVQNVLMNNNYVIPCPPTFEEFDTNQILPFQQKQISFPLTIEIPLTIDSKSLKNSNITPNEFQHSGQMLLRNNSTNTPSRFGENINCNLSRPHTPSSSTSERAIQCNFIDEYKPISLDKFNEKCTKALDIREISVKWFCAIECYKMYEISPPENIVNIWDQVKTYKIRFLSIEALKNAGDIFIRQSQSDSFDLKKTNFNELKSNPDELLMNLIPIQNYLNGNIVTVGSIHDINESCAMKYTSMNPWKSQSPHNVPVKEDTKFKLLTLSILKSLKGSVDPKLHELNELQLAEIIDFEIENQTKESVIVRYSEKPIFKIFVRLIQTIPFMVLLLSFLLPELNCI